MYSEDEETIEAHTLNDVLIDNTNLLNTVNLLLNTINFILLYSAGVVIIIFLTVVLLIYFYVI
jgi:hypothetical protein